MRTLVDSCLESSLLPARISKMRDRVVVSESISYRMYSTMKESYRICGFGIIPCTVITERQLGYHIPPNLLRAFIPCNRVVQHRMGSHPNDAPEQISAGSHESRPLLPLLLFWLILCSVHTSCSMRFLRCPRHLQKALLGGNHYVKYFHQYRIVKKRPPDDC